MTNKFFQAFLSGTIAISGALASMNPAAAFDFSRFQQFVHEEQTALDPDFIESHKLDLTKLDLIYDHDVKVHFISEGAGRRNTFGVTTTSETETNETTLFDNIFCGTDACSTYYNDKEENEAGALKHGDESTVELGTVAAGTTLDFWLESNNRTWHTDASKNEKVSKVDQVIAYEFENYLVLAWEDIWGGGDKDYNDAVFAIDIGEGNLRHVRNQSASVPEPATATAVLGVSAFGLFRRRRKDA